MTKKLVYFFATLIAFSSCGHTNSSGNIKGLTIDPDIKKEVEKYITESELEKGPSPANGLYVNTFIGDVYEDDKPVAWLKGSSEKKTAFKSFYYWVGDTLEIDGAFGMFTSFGFSIKVAKGKATVFHLLSADENPYYAYHEKDSLLFRLEVPCTDTKIILSALPVPAKEQTIFGYVEFKSDDYYQSSGSVDGQEILPRNKERANMKIYFKSIKWTL